LPPDLAFNKGVEWFTEFFFFYGILLSLALWEMHNWEKSSAKQRAFLASLQQKVTESEDYIKTSKKELENAKIESK
jgi:hypothetical protein